MRDLESEGWTEFSGGSMPEELAPDDWVQILCINGVENDSAAKHVIWEWDSGLPYWTVIAYRKKLIAQDRMQQMLDVRDKFIVGRGLWHEFVATLAPNDPQ